MTLKLYSFGPGANSLKPLATLYEKGLEFEPVFVDPAKFEQHSDWFVAINPEGQVPVLDHDGTIVTHTTVINEYLEDVFPDAQPDSGPLRPREAVPDIWLIFAPLKKGPTDWLVEKACELGAARLVPVMTRRTVADRVNTERLRTIAIEAAEQCGRTALPAIAEPVKLAALLRDWPTDRTLFFADETGGDAALAGMQARPGPAALLVGPEGGFDAEERAAIRALPQAVGISLGPRILRAETAAATALSLWMAAAGDWA